MAVIGADGSRFILEQPPTGQLVSVATFGGGLFVGTLQTGIWTRKDKAWLRTEAPSSGEIIAFTKTPRGLVALCKTGHTVTWADGMWWDDGPGINGSNTDHDPVAIVGEPKLLIFANFHMHIPVLRLWH